MAKSNAKVIGQDYGDDVPYKEGEVASGATVYPGMVLEVTGNNNDGDPLLQPVSSVDPTDIVLRVALVPESPPKGADADVPIEHEYSAGENVQYQVFRPGDVLQNALLADGGELGSSSDANVSIGNTLGVNDDGTLKKTSTAGAGVAEAREAVDNSTGSGDQGGVSAARIRVVVS